MKIDTETPIWYVDAYNSPHQSTIELYVATYSGHADLPTLYTDEKEAVAACTLATKKDKVLASIKDMNDEKFSEFMDLIESSKTDGMSWSEALRYCAVDTDRRVFDKNGDPHWIEVEVSVGDWKKLVRTCSESDLPFSPMYGPYSIYRLPTELENNSI